MTPRERAERVRAAGRRLGFDAVGIGPATPAPHGPAFAAWLDAGFAGTMAYLQRTRETRLDPGLAVAGARSVVACALNYFQGSDRPGPAHVARYAWGEDYHAVMAPRLEALLAKISALEPGTTGRAYVDTGPLLERDLAARAGLGWIGKNTMLLHPALGSFFFVGAVVTTADLAPDTPLPDRCGTCTRCLDACPTDAFRGPYVLDATRCIAYLTIEHRGPIPAEKRAGLGELAFGCDVCQDVCPWNRRAPPAAEPAFGHGDVPSLEELASLDEPTYRRRLGRSPLRRARRDGLARNAVVALANRGDGASVPSLVSALAHDSAVVRGHAAWALGRLAGAQAHGSLRAARDRESDPAARAEIEAALDSLAADRTPEGARPHAKMARSDAREGA